MKVVMVQDGRRLAGKRAVAGFAVGFLKNSLPRGWAELDQSVQQVHAMSGFQFQSRLGLNVRGV